MKKKIRLLILLTLIISCNNKSKKEEDFVFLNFKDSLSINVLKIDTKRKTLFLNDSVVLNTTSALIYESHNPTWLFKKTKNKKLLDDKYVYRPTISEINPPYKLIKEENSNTYKVIKDTDTLYFIFSGFEKSSFTIQ